MRAIAVTAFACQHEIERDGLRELGAHAKLMIGAESMRKRDTVSPADDDGVRRQRTLPDSALDAGVDICAGSLVLSDEKKCVAAARRSGRRQTAGSHDVERPPVRTDEVETRW